MDVYVLPNRYGPVSNDANNTTEVNFEQGLLQDLTQSPWLAKHLSRFVIGSVTMGVFRSIAFGAL